MVSQYASDKVTMATQKVSNKATEISQDVSDEATHLTNEASRGMEFVAEEAQTLSLAHNLAQALQNEEELEEEKKNPNKDIAKNRFEQFGDPAATVKSVDEPENPYDYPKALRKYL